MGRSGSGGQPSQNSNQAPSAAIVCSSAPTGNPTPTQATSSQPEGVDALKRKLKAVVTISGEELGPPPFLASLKTKGVILNEEGASKKRQKIVIPASKKVNIIPAVPTPPPAPIPSRTQATSIPAAGARRLRPGSLWESGLTAELKEVIRAPKHFTQPNSLSELQVKDLEKAEMYSLKVASLIPSLVTLNQEYTSLNQQYTSCQSELRASEEGKKKTYEELLKCQGEFKVLNAELEILKTKHAEVVSHKDKLKADLKDYAAAKDRISELEQQLANARAETAEAKALANRFYGDLATAVDGSFANCKEQVLCLNPGIELNLEGLHPRAYVRKGVLVPPSPTASPTASASAAEVTPSEVKPEEVEVPTDVL